MVQRVMNSKDVREKFIQFFQSKGHTAVPQSPVGSDGDPTLLFTNAGMNQFKDVFLGQGTRPYTRAVNSQICVRVSGKHNDLEDVGKDHTHHTSFEMLGNWSFGDYYKKEAIAWAWELLTEVYQIPKHKLFVTIFEKDDEAEALWCSETDISKDRIIRCDAKDNFWEMGETGPCGPCSEIHADLWADHTPNGKIKKADTELTQADLSSERFVELWNLVFIQFNREKDGSLNPLPQTHVDTGAGLERLTAFLQHTPSNYNTDLLKPLINKVVEISGVSYQENIEGMPHRVLADHVRTLTAAIADNISLSNEGRGYVLRRLLRRALRYAQKLNVKTPILCELVDTVVEIMGDHFTQFKAQKEFIKTVIRAEEESFLKTLSSGLELFKELSEALQKKGSKEISGESAFKLYDTYGFPIDLTQVLAEENSLSVDMKTFESLLKEQKERSRKSTKEAQALKQDQLSKTLDFSQLKDLPLHLSEYTDNIARGGEARVITDPQEKIDMARNHSATHLLHEALREILGTHVAQKGSLVETNRLRFDFSHFQAVSKKELESISEYITKKINQKLPVEIFKKNLNEAKEMGAMALFGEKYNPEDVRVVKIGKTSVELCGGTHVQNTEQIEAVWIVSESAVSAGVRRIEAIAGNKAILEYQNKLKEKKIDEILQKETQLQKLTGKQSRVSKEELFKKEDIELEILKEKYVQDLKIAEKKKQEESEKVAGSLATKLEEKIKDKGAYSVLIEYIEDSDLKTLLALSDQLISKKDPLLVILASTQNELGIVLVKSSKTMETLKKANEVLLDILKTAGGKGGGNSSKAQATGCDSLKLKNALENI